MNHASHYDLSLDGALCSQLLVSSMFQTFFHYFTFRVQHWETKLQRRCFESFSHCRTHLEWLSHFTRELLLLSVLIGLDFGGPRQEPVERANRLNYLCNTPVFEVGCELNHLASLPEVKLT